MNRGKIQALCVAFLAGWAMTALPGFGAEPTPAATEGAKPPAPAAMSTPLPAGVEELRYEGGLLTLKAEGADLRSLLAAIAKATGVEIAVQQGVTGKVSASVSGVSAEEGIKAVLGGGAAAGYGAEFARKAGEGAVLQRVVVLPMGKPGETASTETNQARKPALVREVFLPDVAAVYQGQRGPIPGLPTLTSDLVARGYKVTIPEGSGNAMFEVSVPPGRWYAVFGGTLVHAPAAEHTATVSYSLQFVWPGGQKAVERPRLAYPVRPLGDLLLVESTDPATRSDRNELFNGTGDLVWEPPGRIMSIQRHGDFIHLTTDVASREERRSRTVWMRWNVKTKEVKQLEYPGGGALNCLAVIRGTSKDLVWSSTDLIGLVDADGARLLWEGDAVKGHWVRSLDGIVPGVGNTIPMVVLEENYRGAGSPKPLRLAFYDIGTGKVVSEQFLYETDRAGAPRWLPRPSGELVVFPDRAFEVSIPEAQP